MILIRYVKNKDENCDNKRVFLFSVGNNKAAQPAAAKLLVCYCPTNSVNSEMGPSQLVTFPVLSCMAEVYRGSIPFFSPGISEP